MPTAGRLTQADRFNAGRLSGPGRLPPQMLPVFRSLVGVGGFFGFVGYFKCERNSVHLPIFKYYF